MCRGCPAHLLPRHSFQVTGWRVGSSGRHSSKAAYLSSVVVTCLMLARSSPERSMFTLCVGDAPSQMDLFYVLSLSLPNPLKKKTYRSSPKCLVLFEGHTLLRYFVGICVFFSHVDKNMIWKLGSGRVSGPHMEILLTPTQAYHTQLSNLKNHPRFLLSSLWVKNSLINLLPNDCLSVPLLRKIIPWETFFFYCIPCLDLHVVTVTPFIIVHRPFVDTGFVSPWSARPLESASLIFSTFTSWEAFFILV